MRPAFRWCAWFSPAVVLVLMGCLWQWEWLAPYFLSANIIFCLTGLVVVLFLIWWFKREMQQRIKNLVHLETRHLLDVQEAVNLQLQQANHTLRVIPCAVTI